MLDYTRQPLLKPEVEADLKLKMEPLWLQEPRLSGMQIAKQLKFGQPKTPFELLQPRYVYFYRQKFNLPLRAKPRFKKKTVGLPAHRYKNSPEELKVMSPETFITKLNDKLPLKDKNGKIITANQAQRCFLTILFWTPLRESEIFERVQNMPLADEKIRNDFEILPDKLTIHLLRKKKKYHEKTDEPISIPLVFSLMNEVVDYLQSKSWERTFNNKPNKVKKTDAYGFPIKVKGAYQFELNHRPFAISKSMADNWVKFVFEGFYCHFFRFNYITSATEMPDMKISELRAKTKLTMGALEKYIFTPAKAEEEFDAKKAQELRNRGVIQ